MYSKSFLWTVLCTGMMWASAVEALEKRTETVSHLDSSAWNSSSSCRVSYYNICTGWVWVWDGFPHESRFGVLVDACCAGATSVALQQVLMFIPSGAPAGRGFTGTLSAYASDASGCPTGVPIFSHLYLPTSTFTTVPFEGVSVPSRLVIVAQTSDSDGIGDVASYGTDRPAAGPTGPQACGLCYPVTRQTRSFMFGTADAPLCPGSTFNDGVCDAELFWDIDFACPVDVHESTWGTIKNLYR